MIEYLAALFAFVCLFEEKFGRSMAAFLVSNIFIGLMFWEWGGELVSVFQVLMSVGTVMVFMFVMEGLR